MDKDKEIAYAEVLVMIGIVQGSLEALNAEIDRLQRVLNQMKARALDLRDKEAK